VLTAAVVGGAIADHDPLSPPAPWWNLGKTALAAAALFPDLDPPRTTAAFASVDDVGIVERAALRLP
jgi:hypothetical protein